MIREQRATTGGGGPKSFVPGLGGEDSDITVFAQKKRNWRRKILKLGPLWLPLTKWEEIR